MRFRVSLLLAVFAVSLSATAQEIRNTISGRVLLGNGNPASNARIEVRNIRTGEVVGFGYTNSLGTYAINNIPPAELQIVATLGLREVRERLAARDGIADTVDLRLPASEEELNGSAAEGPVSVATLKVPGKARKNFEKAEKALDKREIEKAQEYIAKALEIHPRYAQALTFRALLAMDAGNVDAAVPDLQKAIESDYSYPLAYMIMGAAFNAQHKFDEAIRVLDRGIGMSPNSWQGWFELGKAYLGKGDYSVAIRNFTKAESFVGDKFAPLHLAIAHAYLGQKNFAEAVARLQRYLTQDPDGTHVAQAQQMLKEVQAFTAAKVK